MKKKNTIAATLFALLLGGCSSSEWLTVESGECDRQDATARVQVEKGTYSLTETKDGRQVAVPCQTVTENGISYLYFPLSGKTAAGEKRRFCLRKAPKGRTLQGTEKEMGKMAVKDDGSSLTLLSNGKNILQYNYALSSLPDGVSQIFARSGYIHPACTPSGFVFTLIQPVDHRHHYGIWNPWTHLIYEDKLYDLWNLGDSLGTVRADRVDAVYEGDVMSGFDAWLQHVIFAPGGEKTIMNERWRIRAVDVGDAFVWDFESELHPCAEKPITIQTYRYQGFGCRATDKWTRDNCTMMTSEGLERPQIDGSTARWIYVNGQVEGQRSGCMFMSFPENYNTPEPLRIWNEDASGGRGDVFVNFCPTKTKDWVLQPSETYRLRYRVVAYDGEMNPQRAELMWQDFAHPIEITK